MQLPAPLDRLLRRLVRAWEERAIVLKAASFAGVGVITNTAVLVIASYWVPVVLAKLLAIGASFLVNFLLSHFVVFRPRAGQAERSAE